MLILTKLSIAIRFQKSKNRQWRSQWRIKSLDDTAAPVPSCRVSLMLSPDVSSPKHLKMIFSKEGQAVYFSSLGLVGTRNAVCKAQTLRLLNWGGNWRKLASANYLSLVLNSTKINFLQGFCFCCFMYRMPFLHSLVCIYTLS